jgi:hypothetical protein
VTAATLGVSPPDSTDAHHRPLSFVEHLADTGLEKCFGFWRAHKRGDRMPPKSALVMSRMPPGILPNLFLYERTPEQRFRCRLAGTAVAQQFGKDPTGCHLDELIVPASLESRVTLFRRVLDTQCPVVYGGQLANSEHGWKTFKRLLLPVANEDGASAFLFGMVLFPKPSRSGVYIVDSSIGLDFEVWATPAETV